VNSTIFLIVGESGSGKTLLVSALEKQRGLKSIASYTTRPKRNENEYGHTFVNDEEFSQLQNIVAYTEYNGYKYCATSEQVENHDLYVIDKAGVDFFKKAYHGKKQIKIIYIKSSISIRVKRMEERFVKDNNIDINNLTSQDIKSILSNFGNIMERIVNDSIEFKNAEYIADLVVDNHSNRNFQYVVREVWEFIRKERSESNE
jgi:guanylate kinase